jgi:hypothetical protein
MRITPTKKTRQESTYQHREAVQINRASSDCSHTRSAVSVMPGVLATLEKLGAIGFEERNCPFRTAWHCAQTDCANAAPFFGSLVSCATAWDANAITATNANEIRLISSPIKLYR